MSRVLFVSNGHGEEAIAARIAQELVELGDCIQCDHLALVGDFGHPSVMRQVGPRKTMPSGGLLAMGNVRNIIRDLCAGLAGLTIAQLRFLSRARGTYRTAVGVGDVFALLMALRVRAGSTVFVGTAKSVFVAPYGQLEEAVLSRAATVFVRDLPTAQRLRSHGIPAQAGNVIVDLHGSEEPPQNVAFEPLLALLPGSRTEAYEDAVFLCEVVRRVARETAGAGALLSVAPGLDPARFAAAFAADGWRVEVGRTPAEPFSLFEGEREIVRAYSGAVGAVFARAQLALGQAGTANEAAAAAGIPVVAFVMKNERNGRWYRKRQADLLGDALLLLERDAPNAARVVTDLLLDTQRRSCMAEAGRSRIGPAGARAIARAVAALSERSV